MKKTLLLLLWFCSHCYGQVFTIWNEAGQNISAIGMYQPSGGFTSGDWGLPSMTNGQGPITIYSSYFANIYCTPVANGTTTGIQSYVNGAGPWPGQTWGGGSNAQYYVVFVATGTTPSTPHVYTPATYTNDGCITLNNNTTQPQYYQVSATGPQGQISNASPCASSMVQTTSGGVSVYGSSAYGDANTWLAVYPGDIITVCQTILAGTNAGIWQMCALQAPAGLTPCGLSGIDNPRCVELCDDGQVVNGGAGWATGCQTMSQTSTPASSTSSGVNQGPLAGPNTQMDSGTNGIIWANNTNGGLMLNITGQTGFAALHNDLAAMNAAQAMEANGIGQTILNAQNAIVNAIRTNSASVILSNVVFSNQFTVTNWPTNYPDAAAIGWLSMIATNTGRTNGIDTNLDGLAAQIASNTAAPLAFTNLCLPSYSTNPSDTVTYASNTLAGPINASLQGYAQSAATAAQAITIGGSPGDLLTITFSLPVVGNFTIDCNPMNNADVADFASWFRSLMQWVVGLGFIGFVLRDGMKATQNVFLSPQGQFPKLMVLGNSVGWPLGAVYIVALIAAMAAVPFVIVTWFSVGATGQMWWQQVAINPFSGDGVGRSVSLSLWLADQFLPMSYIVSSSLYYLSFRFALGGMVTVAATIVRALMA